MIALGLILIVAAAVVALAGWLSNNGSGDSIDHFQLLGANIDASSGELLLYGAIIGAVAMLGLNMLLAGLGRGFKRRVRTHREVKAERHRAEELEHELEEERAAHVTDVRDASTSTYEQR